MSNSESLQFTHSEIVRAIDQSAEYQVVKELLTYPPSSQDQEISRYLANFPNERRDSLLLAWMKEKGNALYVKGQYENAITKYQVAMRSVLESNFEFLSSQYLNKGYMGILTSLRKWTMHLDFVSCCNNIAQAYVKLGERSKALDWLQEVEILYEFQNLLFPAYRSAGGMRSKVLEYCTFHMKAALRFAQIFSELRNTSACSYFAYRCTTILPICYPEDIPEIETLRIQSNVDERLRLRNPDVTYIDSWNVEEPSLQLRGIWNKLELKSNFGPRHRYRSAGWIWQGKLYIFGGEIPNSLRQAMWDIWCLDLNLMDRWRRLPDLPINLYSAAYRATKAIVYGNHAWLFSGNVKIPRFDMLAERWDVVTTTMIGSDWPYDHQIPVLDPCIESCDGMMYVFGGDQSQINKNVDVFMVLNMRNLQWQRLRGTIERQETYEKPSYRRAAASWIIPAEKRLYIMYGSSSAAHTYNTTRNPKAYHCDDLWSYSIARKLWTRERIRGNYPSPRDFMCSTYHNDLDFVVTFGGMNEKVPTHGPDAITHISGTSDTFYGDTFVMDQPNHNWRQVITRNFPAWRAGAHCIVDDETGHIYLSGGGCNRLYLTGEEIVGSYAFGDIWRLDLDLPGHKFDEKAFFELSPFLKIGSWRRCYSCKSIGRNYLKCQGSCKGKYVFCSVTCQRNAWQTHKESHGCRKL